MTISGKFVETFDDLYGGRNEIFLEDERGVGQGRMRMEELSIAVKVLYDKLKYGRERVRKRVEKEYVSHGKDL